MQTWIYALAKQTHTHTKNELPPALGPMEFSRKLGQSFVFLTKPKQFLNPALSFVANISHSPL